MHWQPVHLYALSPATLYLTIKMKHQIKTTLLTLSGIFTTAVQAELTEVTFGTNWVAQAEHGGFYQSIADGTYEQCGLNVTIVPGGPQVNNRALLLAGKLDYHMGTDMLPAFNAVQQDIPVVSVAAMFQKDPLVLISHPGKAKSFSDLSDMQLLISDGDFHTWYQWAIAAHNFSAENRLNYTFNPAPFLADENIGMQGYLTSEPYLVEQEGGFKPEIFLLADAGYSNYSTTIETMADTIDNKPEEVKCFVDGSIKGWYNYLHNDNRAADALIMKDNPEMTPNKIEYAIDKMISEGIVISGDATTKGIGVITETKVTDFFQKMVAAGILEADLNYKSAFSTAFTGNGVGMELIK